MTRAYLDHASSSPLRPMALEAMLPYLRGNPADPGRVHSDGRVTRVAIEDARAAVAALVGARPREVVFTATGTEAVNTAVWGAVTRGADRLVGRGHVVTTAVEHSAVLESCRRSEVDVSIVGVDGSGRIDEAEIMAACRPETVLVSVQLANHEVGTVQSAVPGIVTAVRERGVLVHVDACAAVGHVPLDFAALGADLCSITGHKLGGPKGSAALLIRRGLRLPPFVVGGAQERARRAGIEDVPAIVGFGAAAAELYADDTLTTEAGTARAQTDGLLAAALAVAGVTQLGDPVDRLPHLVCLAVDGVEAEPVLLGLDQHGVAVHSGSSCSSETLEPSPVLAAMGVDADRSLRPSVGWSTTVADVAAFVDAFSEVVGKLRALGGG
ncbi:MAG TPA: cysteine desulfurase family protein [Acidimicrobiia bacterium]